MSLFIEKAGVLDTIQDTGRYGFSRWGINTNGAMDWYAAQLANALVGNDPDEAVVEIHFPSSQFVFTQPALISVTGADFDPFINHSPAAIARAMAVKKDSILTFRNKKRGARCYLAVQGGLALPRWLNSASTNLKIQCGGFEGRALRKGDHLPVLPSRYRVSIENDLHIHAWKANTRNAYDQPDEIGFIEGPEWSWLTHRSQQRMISEEFRIHPSSDRMGSFLIHEPLQFQSRSEMLSSAVTYGTLQALPEGRLLILMADHQTTGGYPRPGHVVSAHLPKLAQLTPNESFRFRKVTLQEAEKMIFSLRQDLTRIQNACREKLDQYYAAH